MSIPNSPNWAQSDTDPLDYINYGVLRPSDLSAIIVQKSQLGPLELGNSLGNIAAKYWLVTYGAPFVSIRPEISGYWGPSEILFQELDEVVSIDFTFDQIGRPITLMLINDGTIKLNWFDPIMDEQVTTTISTGTSIAAGFDIATNTSDSMSDAFIAYVRDNKLYWRLQRDRWETEYDPSVEAQDLAVLSMGMTDQNKFQIEYDFTGGLITT